MTSRCKRIRRSFAKIPTVVDLPNLIETQKMSYARFLQADINPEDRQDVGLQGAFNSVFPIYDFNETSSLEFVSYQLGTPTYDVLECLQKGMTFAAPIKVIVRLVVWDAGDGGESKSIRDVKEQEVYFGEMPLMTDKGTFIINGTERVIVSQLHRSPGVFFDSDKGKTHSSGKVLYSARVIPYRGSWLDLEFDHKDILHVRIDRRRKLPATILLRALGYSAEELLNMFYDTELITIGKKGLLKKMDPEMLKGQRAVVDIKDPKSGDLLVKQGRKYTGGAIKKLIAAGIKTIPVEQEEIIGKIIAGDIVDTNTGEVIAACNTELTEEKFEELKESGVKELGLLFMDPFTVGSYFRDTLMLDNMKDSDNAIIEIYRRMRPGEPPTIETAKALFNNLFFNSERYDLSEVGRLKFNYKFKKDTDRNTRILTKEDIVETVKYLISLRNGLGEVDDIDHLGNRRVRAVGELIENQHRIGLVRMERTIKERMSIQGQETLMPHDFVNAKPVSAVIKEFFGSSQLSQFMDQTNPLSEITHKRRVSALGPGGLTRERAGFEVRDVHTTHYGRICPIETPEGPNIGLIASLSTYARVNEYGFLETPYRVVKDGAVTDEVRYMTALEEEGTIIAQASAPVDKKGRFVRDLVSTRTGGDFSMVAPSEVGFMDVSPKQLVSVAASMIPFLENDDANRALMGSNMQRQAVPLLKAEAPLVGTGMEAVVAADSGVTVVAKNDGVVESVDATRIVVKLDSGEGGGDGTGVDIYNLIKFQRSNQNTCINQRSLVKVGHTVSKGEVIADGPSTEEGELALGKNVTVAFMPWNGYNFEDSILISERMVIDDAYTSVHIEEFESVCRDTKLGKEEITRDIPNLGEEQLKDLDDSGIIRIGAEVSPNDILVGKITPKGETQLTPEEKLLRAIFGDKAGDVKDTSMRVPPGVEGTVIGAKVFSRRGVDKDERAILIEEEEEARLLKDQKDEMGILERRTSDNIAKLIIGETAGAKVLDPSSGKVIVEKGKKITVKMLEQVSIAGLDALSDAVSADKSDELAKLIKAMEGQKKAIQDFFGEKLERLKRGDELPPGVIKMVKISVAIKRKLSVGDKMAGRHGNKGVLSKIVPVEDMPYMEDGTQVDIVLNPLGVPSRMNVGQILESHLGWAAKGLGRKITRFIDENYGADKIKGLMKDIYSSPEMAKQIDAMADEEIFERARKMSKGAHMAVPVFEGASEEEIKNLLALADLPVSGKMTLFDGRSGEKFDQQVTVGVMYILKLHHLVDDKIHARSTGPYSLVTQQPLGGKAQFGGQRLGEMEVWAMEAYGAAHCLQEFLTVKSDDVAGRTRMYESIVKGENTLEAGLPESFNVVIKEMQSLGLNVELLED
ncbi:MAG: DNA-directed RNA polymerase subunit beta [Proteobacteria bacterium]|nr:DNA-directed RNA polymerase subunit beta [Pseudomonadota bacterium]